MRDLMELTICDVESLSLRAVAGHGDQAELTITTRRGALNLRLLPHRDRTIRLVDLRQRDKRKARKRGVVTVSFDQLTKAGGGV